MVVALGGAFMKNFHFPCINSKGRDSCYPSTLHAMTKHEIDLLIASAFLCCIFKIKKIFLKEQKGNEEGTGIDCGNSLTMLRP